MTEQTRNIQSATAEQPQPAINTPTLCIANCGFFGSIQRANYCSKCYIDYQKKKDAEQKQETILATAPRETPAPSPDMSSTSVAIECVSPLVVPTSTPTSIDIPITFINTSAATDTAVPITIAGTDTAVVNDVAAILSASTIAAAVPSSSTVTESPAKKPKMKCAQCSKKLTPMTFVKCRCSDELLFCASHRYPHSHSCTFDAKKQQAAALTKANPVVNFAKMEKI